MKTTLLKIRLIIGFLILCSTFIKSQTSIKFENRFLPNKNYENTNEITSKFIMNFEGDKDYLETFKANGIKLPIVAETTMNTKSEMKTLDKKTNNIPFVNHFVKISTTQQNNGTTKSLINPLEGSYIYGYYENGKNMVIDSIQSDKLNIETKNMLKNVIENITKSVVFPENSLNIGDTFDQNLPMNFPLADLGEVSFTININYLLKEIKNGFATFDTTITLKLNSEIPDIELTSKGSGKGIVEYDINNKLTSKNDSQYNLELIATLGKNLRIVVKSESETKYSLKIVP